MFKKRLISLAVILALLAVVFALKKWRQPLPSIEEQMALKQFAPPEFLVSDVAKIEIYRGGKEDKKISLTKKEG